MQTYSFISYILISAVVGFLLALRAFRGRSGLSKIILLMVAMVLLTPAAYTLLASYGNIFDPRYSVYKEFYNDIDVGMTKEDVFRLREAHYPGSGSRTPPIVLKDTATELKFFMHPESHSEPNCEGIFLRVRENKVTEKRYSAD